jgi:hypothetical protein
VLRKLYHIADISFFLRNYHNGLYAAAAEMDFSKRWEVFFARLPTAASWIGKEFSCASFRLGIYKSSFLAG